MVKTVVLEGSEVCVSGLDGQNTIVKNLGEKSVFASAFAGVSEGADNVVEIPASSGEVLYDTHGTVYLSGTGKVQITGTNYDAVNFKSPSANVRDRQTAAEEIPAIPLDFATFALADISENVQTELQEQEE